MDALIAVLALTALAVNVLASHASSAIAATPKRFPSSALLLPLLAVALGLLVYVRALSPDLKSVWQVGSRRPGRYVGAMLLTAISCRVGAYLYRQSQPRLAAVYFFATAAATLVGGDGFPGGARPEHLATNTLRG